MSADWVDDDYQYWMDAVIELRRQLVEIEAAVAAYDNRYGRDDEVPAETVLNYIREILGRVT